MYVNIFISNSENIFATINFPDSINFKKIQQNHFVSFICTPLSHLFERDEIILF